MELIKHRGVLTEKPHCLEPFYDYAKNHKFYYNFLMLEKTDNGGDHCKNISLISGNH